VEIKKRMKKRKRQRNKRTLNRAELEKLKAQIKDNLLSSKMHSHALKLEKARPQQPHYIRQILVSSINSHL
jgi:hypothetical protein